MSSPWKIISDSFLEVEVQFAQIMYVYGDLIVRVQVGCMHVYVQM